MQSNPFLNKSAIIVWSLFLMTICGGFSWYYTNFFGIPVIFNPTDIVRFQNFFNKMLFNFDTTTGIA